MKKIIFIFSITLLLLFSGCTFSEIKGKIPFLPGEKTSGKKDFIGGTNGLTAEIKRPVEGGKAYESQLFKIEVLANNQGEAEAEGTTCVSGLSSKYFPGFSGCECQDFSLKGKRKEGKESLEGEDEMLVFEAGEIKSKELKDFAVTAKTRYDYQTFGIIKACLKKDTYSKEGCQITSEKNILKSVSSAPITIEKVTQDIIPETDQSIELRLNIQIKKSGEGDLYDLDEDKSQCETPLDIKRRIEVKLVNAPGTAICNPTELRTKRGTLTTTDEATASCKIKNIRINDEKGYESEMVIELDYTYETIDSNKFEVVS